MCYYLIRREVGITQDMIKKLFEARCSDLHIQPTIEQEKRFIEYCNKSVNKRTLSLTEVLF